MKHDVVQLNKIPSPNFEKLLEFVSKGKTVTIVWDPGGPDPKDPKENTPIGVYILTAKNQAFLDVLKIARKL